MGMKTRNRLLTTRHPNQTLLLTAHWIISGGGEGGGGEWPISILGTLHSNVLDIPRTFKFLVGHSLPWSLILAFRLVPVLRTDTVLNWIILYGITTGAITSIVAIVLLICVSIIPNLVCLNAHH